MSVKRYWVDPIELTSLSTHNEPDTYSGWEAMIVVNAPDYDALAARLAKAEAALRPVLDALEYGYKHNDFADDVPALIAEGRAALADAAQEEAP